MHNILTKLLFLFICSITFLNVMYVFCYWIFQKLIEKSKKDRLETLKKVSTKNIKQNDKKENILYVITTNKLKFFLNKHKLSEKHISNISNYLIRENKCRSEFENDLKAIDMLLKISKDKDLKYINNYLNEFLDTKEIKNEYQQYLFKQTK